MRRGASIAICTEARKHEIGFVVMREQGLTEALTGDRHFAQAGFSALLK